MVDYPEERAYCQESIGAKEPLLKSCIIAGDTFAFACSCQALLQLLGEATAGRLNYGDAWFGSCSKESSDALVPLVETA